MNDAAVDTSKRWFLTKTASVAGAIGAAFFSAAGGTSMRSLCRGSSTQKGSAARVPNPGR